MTARAKLLAFLPRTLENQLPRRCRVPIFLKRPRLQCIRRSVHAGPSAPALNQTRASPSRDRKSSLLNSQPLLATPADVDNSTLIVVIHYSNEVSTTSRFLLSAFPYADRPLPDRKSTRLNSSHGYISYA